MVCSAVDEFLLIRPIGQISAIGLGIPGVVRDDGVISQIPSIPSWDGIQIEKRMAQRYSVPIFVENDVKLMTIQLASDNLQAAANLANFLDAIAVVITVRLHQL